MAENRIKAVAALLGIYPGEAFKIEGMGNKLYKLCGDGVAEIGPCFERPEPQLLQDILNGSRGVVCRPP